MKIIYDIGQKKLYAYIKNYILNRFKNIEEVTCSYNSNVDFIFKFVSKHEDIEELKKMALKEHVLIAIVNSDKIVFKLLELYPLCYIRLDNFDEDLDKCCSLMDSIYNGNYMLVSFRIKNSIIQLKSSSIYYIESFSHYLTIYTNTGEYVVRDTLSNLIKQLFPYGFRQVHRSYIVNKNYIKRITQHEVTLITSEKIPIGDKYKNNTKDII
jgi:DNA-binding LytR/AlgR family response regulator